MIQVKENRTFITLKNTLHIYMYRITQNIQF